ncbi:hypothetical protein EDB80DRAFT_713203 [Ilyonectria destructans]|nr:hypothetical protein EDB80DRAFT_713203 [Ilyonectria destructans]
MSCLSALLRSLCPELLFSASSIFWVRDWSLHCVPGPGPVNRPRHEYVMSQGREGRWILNVIPPPLVYDSVCSLVELLSKTCFCPSSAC